MCKISSVWNIQFSHLWECHQAIRTSLLILFRLSSQMQWKRRLDILIGEMQWTRKFKLYLKMKRGKWWKSQKTKNRWGADGYSLSSINLLNHYNTLGLGITFKKIGKLDLAIYIDSDYAGSLLDFRCTTGFCTMLGGNLVTWRSIKQNVVSKSSTEGEFWALLSEIEKVLRIRSILKELWIIYEGPIRVYYFWLQIWN